MSDRRLLDQPPRAFISYARSDGEEFARALRERLERDEPEITLWQDRTDMGPADWWRQITEALDRVPFMVLVLTHGSVRSPVVWKEWRYARQQGVCVVLVKGDHQLDFGSLPRWMRKVHCYDLACEWQTFVRYLKSPPPVIRVPFMAPDLPEGFIDRPHEFDQLRSLLLDHERREPVAITTALRGAGGLGKTTLAVALCHDEEIQAAFDDGIFWITLGKRPNLLDGLTKLYAALTGDRPAFRDVEDAASHLATRLDDKTCLIILDDVWDQVHLRPLRRVGKGYCAWLITTRQLEVAADAQRVDVDTMSPEESVSLLIKRLDRAPTDLGPFCILARRLGWWPLLLELTGSALRLRRARGDTLEGALAYINRALDRKGVGAFDSYDPTERHQSMTLTIEVSVELLDPEDRYRFHELAIFPEDIDIPLSAMGALWGLDDFVTEELVQHLADLSLILLDLSAGTSRLHDVMRVYLSEQLMKRSIELASLHARLVDAWGNPHRLTDAYAWHRLAYHLVGAERREQLRSLLLDFEWLHSKLLATDPGALIADFDVFPNDAELGLVQAAIRLSAHVLVHDKTQLGSQLLGRLLSFETPALQSLLVQVRHTRRISPWLYPLNACLTPPGGALLRRMEGHEGEVRALAVMSDGRRAVSAADDRTLRVWDLGSGALQHTLAGHAGGLRGVAVAPEGRRAVTATGDGALRVWDLDSGAMLLTLQGHAGEVRAVAVTPDGRRAVSSADDGALWVWDLDSGALLRKVQGNAGLILAVAVAPSGSHAVIAAYDRTLRVWDIDSGMLIHTMVGHRGWACAVAIAPDGTRAVSAADDRTLRVWDLGSGSLLHTLAGHAGGVRAVALTPDGRRAVSAADDRTLRVWDLGSGTLLHTLAGHGGGVRAVALTPDGRRAVTATGDGALRVWDLDSGTAPRTLEGYADCILAVAVTPDGHRAVSAGSDGTLRIWDLRNASLLNTLAGHVGGVRAVAVLPDGRRAVSGAGDGTLHVWDLTRGVLSRKLASHSGMVNAVAVTPDGHHAVSAENDGALRVWDLESGELIRTLAGHVGGVRAVAVTPDGRRAVSAAQDRALRVWDLGSGKQVRTLVGHARGVRAVAVTSDGRRVLSAADDRTLRVWDLGSGALLCTLAGHARGINAVAVTPDGRRAVSGADDETLRVWDIQGGRIIAVFHGDAPFWTCTISPDGMTYIGGDSIGRVHFLRLDEGRGR
jgi:WD40 repeat protein